MGSMGNSPPPTTEQQKHLVALFNRCMAFTDRNGKVLSRESTRLSSKLMMQYKDQNITIKFGTANSAGSKASCWVKVWHKSEFVLSAKGNFMRGPIMVDAYDILAMTYVPGDWEKKIPRIQPDRRPGMRK